MVFPHDYVLRKPVPLAFVVLVELFDFPHDYVLRKLGGECQGDDGLVAALPFPHDYVLRKRRKEGPRARFLEDLSTRLRSTETSGVIDVEFKKKVAFHTTTFYGNLVKRRPKTATLEKFVFPHDYVLRKLVSSTASFTSSLL